MMIKSCLDVKTHNDYDVFFDLFNNTDIMGLMETVDFITWKDNWIVDPGLGFFDEEEDED